MNGNHHPQAVFAPSRTTRLLPVLLCCLTFFFFALPAFASLADSDLSALQTTITQLTVTDDRATGSTGAARAAAYIAERFASAQPTQTGALDFQLPTLHHDGSMLSINGEHIPIHPLLYNAITPQNLPKQGLSGPVVYVGRGELQDFNSMKIEGAIVLMEFNSGRNWLNAASLGATALIYVNRGQSGRPLFADKTELSPIQFPCFWADQATLAPFIDQPPPQATITSSMRWHNATAQNIYALFEGSDQDKTTELLVVEAFYDASSFIPGMAPGADEALSIASLLALADHLHRYPPKRPFLLVATDGHSKGLAGMRETIWTVDARSKDLRRLAKTLKQEKKTRTAYIATLEQVLAGPPGELSKLELQAPLRETIKLRIDRLSARLMTLRMEQQGTDDEAAITRLAEERLMLRQLGWRTDFSTLTDREQLLLRPLVVSAISTHKAVLLEVDEQERMLKTSRKFRSLLSEYEPRAIVSLHISSHGNGLGAFHQGFLYPLRSRINRTAAFRVIDQVLHEAATLTNKAPPFTSTLRPNRLQPWQDLLPDKPQLGGEVSCLAGLPGLTLATVGDLRTPWGTPFDTPDRIDWEMAVGQWRLVRAMITALDKAPDLPLGYIRNGFSTVSGKASLLLHGELFAEHPAPETMLLAFQGPARFHVRTDLRGQFLLKGVADKKHVQDKVILEGYKFSRTDGNVDWAIDKKLTGKNAYRVKMQRQAMQTDLVMFNCRQTTIFNLLEPRSLRYMTKLQLIDGRRDAPPIRYWYSRIDTRASIIASIFLEPGTHLKMTLSDSVLKKKMILTNATKENPLGSGYNIDEHPSLFQTGYLAARDIWTLIEPRIDNLERHGIHNERIKNLQQAGMTALNDARQALADYRYDRFSEEASRSWALASRVYDHVEKTQKDVLFGVLFYIALFVPFAFCMERLLFGYVSIYKRILAFSGILAILILVIANVHPAFELAYSPTVVILAFFIIGLSFLVTMIIVLRFEDEMVLLQRRASHKRPAEISNWKAFMAAFFLGVSNLRRRRLRTVLTCLTLIILTFTIMSFTSVKSMRRQTKLHFENTASYQGMLLKDIGWKDLPQESLPIFRSLFGGRTEAAPRVWLEASEPTRAIRIQADFGGVAFNLQGLTGLDSQEPRLSGMDSILSKGRWFNKDEPFAAIIPDSLAARLGIDPDGVSHQTLTLWGQKFEVVGSFSEKAFKQFPDLDGEILTPVIFPSESMMEMTDIEKEAMESGEDVHSFQGRYRHIAPEQILIVPAETLLQMGGKLKSVALHLDAAPDEALPQQLTEHFNLTLFSGEQDGVFLYNASDTMSYSGMPNIIIPLLISILIVLNTMISSVFERKHEIAVYTSVGLAPSHVSFLFIAEALAFAVLSVVLGYLLAQTSAGLLAGTTLWQGITVNYSSTAGVAAMILVMGVVLLSVIYPSRVAANIAIPDVNQTWEMPETKNDAISITLPFLMRSHEHGSICGFLYAYFKGHQDVSHGIFSTGPIEVVDMSMIDDEIARWLPMADDCLHLRAKVWLAPFDFGIMQSVDLRFCHAGEGKEFLEINVTMSRKAGEHGVWRRVNASFLHALRKQLLIWRSLDSEGHRQYQALLPKQDTSAEESL